MSLTRREFLSSGIVSYGALSYGAMTYRSMGLGVMSYSGLLNAETSQSIPLILRTANYQWNTRESNSIQLWEFSQPSLHLKQFQPVEIIVNNQLPDASSIHWHGMRVENTMDGVSGLTQQPISAKGSFRYQVPTNDAGTYWAHAHHKTYEQLARGLYMPIVVEEATPYPVDKDLLFVIDDWRLKANGQIDQNSFGQMHDWAHGGRLGNLVTVNRNPNEKLVVKAGDRVRLRLLNAANARIFDLELGQLTTTVVAKDGQPLMKPKAIRSSITLGPAERYDVIIDIPADWAGNYAINTLIRGQRFQVAQWQVSLNKTAAPVNWKTVPALPPNNLPDTSFVIQHEITLDMSGGAMGNLQAAFYKGSRLSVQELIAQQQVWTFNGVANIPEAPLLQVKVGDGVLIHIENNTRWPHAMHLHGHHFLAHNLLMAENDIWQDTVLMSGNQKTDIRFRAERPGKWLLHCHMIEHQAAGMVTWIEVVS